MKKTNKMAEVAKMFNKELGEKFTIIDGNRAVIDACFNEEGIACFHPNGEEASLISSNVLKKLLNGTYRIKEMPWKPELNEEYYTPMFASLKKYQLITNNGSREDDILYKRGLICKTQEQVEELAQLLFKTAREFQGFDEESDSE